MKTSLVKPIIRGRGALLLAGATLMGAACTAEQPAVPGPPFDAWVLDRTEPAAGTESAAAEFALQRRTLRTFTSFAQLEGASLRLRQGGVATITLDDDGNVRSDEPIRGGAIPDLRYGFEDGAVIPRDDSTLTMLSAAYQFEQIIPRLIEASEPEVAQAFAAHAPMEIFFGPAQVIRAGEVETDRLKANAFFSPPGWQFAIALPSAGVKVTLAADARVIAHELGHGVFQVAFFGGENDACDASQAAARAADPFYRGRLDLEAAIRGLNEGFADWMSFAVTGGTNPIEVLNGDEPFNDRPRAMDEDNFRWPDIYKEDAKVPALGCESFYCLGTLFARSLVATYRAEGHTLDDAIARRDFSRIVVAAMNGTAARLRTIGLPLPTDDVAHCRGRGEVSAALDPPVIGPFLAAFLQGLPAEMQPRVCDELASRFEDGFPPAFHVGCTP